MKFARVLPGQSDRPASNPPLSGTFSRPPMAERSSSRPPTSDRVVSSHILLDAAKLLKPHTIRRCIEGGINVNARDSAMNTAIILVAGSLTKDHKAFVIRYLARNGADVNARNSSGESALHKAAFRGDLEAIEALIECGADVNATNKFGTTVLMATITSQESQSKDEIVELLIRNDVDITPRNISGFDALDYAVSSEYDNIRRMLIAAGEVDMSEGDDFLWFDK